MTQYNPIAECAENGEPFTTDDMVDAGYDDFDEPTGVAGVLSLLAEAMEAAGSGRGDDSDSWRAANDILGAMRAVERMAGAEAEFNVKTKTVEERFQDEKVEYEKRVIEVEVGGQ